MASAGAATKSSTIFKAIKPVMLFRSMETSFQIKMAFKVSKGSHLSRRSCSRPHWPRGRTCSSLHTKCKSCYNQIMLKILMICKRCGRKFQVLRIGKHKTQLSIRVRCSNIKDWQALRSSSFSWCATTITTPSILAKWMNSKQLTRGQFKVQRLQILPSKHRHRRGALPQTTSIATHSQASITVVNHDRIRCWSRLVFHLCIKTDCPKVECTNQSTTSGVCKRICDNLI